MNKQEQVTYWGSLSEEWQSSGEPQKQFCERKGINYSQFITWRSKLLTTEDKSRVSLQPVNVTPSPITASNNLTNPSNLRETVVHLSLPNGVKISIPPGAQATTIRDVLTCLGVSQCSH